MKDRIKELRKHEKLNQTDFGALLGVSLSAVQKWESGENTPAESVIELMCQKTSVNGIWLRTGNGEPFASKSREAEMGDLVRKLMADRPEAFRVKLITALLRFDPNGPEWQVLENIYNNIAGETKKADS